MKKKIIVILGLLVVVGAVVAYYLFSMQFKDMSKVNTDYEMSAIDLIKAFQTNDSVANKSYAEKNIEVNGVVSDIEYADSTVNIKIADDSSGSYIIFSFQKNEQALLKSIKQGDMIFVKGSCSGAIYSDILSAYSINFKRCVLINRKK